MIRYQIFFILAVLVSFAVSQAATQCFDLANKTAVTAAKSLRPQRRAEFQTLSIAVTLSGVLDVFTRSATPDGRWVNVYEVKMTSTGDNINGCKKSQRVSYLVKVFIAGKTCANDEALGSTVEEKEEYCY